MPYAIPPATVHLQRHTCTVRGQHCSQLIAVEATSDIQPLKSLCPITVMIIFFNYKKEEIAALVGQILQSRQVLQDSKFRDVPLWMATASRSLKAGQQS